MNAETREQIAEEIGRVTGKVGPHERAAADRILALTRSPVERKEEGTECAFAELVSAADGMLDAFCAYAATPNHGRLRRALKAMRYLPAQPEREVTP